MKSLIYKLFRSELFRSTWRRMIYLWKPMAAWTILVWGIITIILAPVSSAVLGLQFFRSGQLVVGNEELISWFLSPVGVSYVLLASSVTLTGWILRFTGIFQIVTDDIFERPVNFGKIMQRIIGKAHLLFRLCVCVVATGLLLLLPLLGGFALIYELMLDSYDINYYLSATPVEWHLTLIVCLIWLTVWILGVIYIAGRVLFALPAYLHSQKSIRKSIRYAWQMGPEKSKKQLISIVPALSFWIIIRVIADIILFATALWIINWISGHIGSLRLVALATGFYVITSLTLDAIISFLGFSYVSTLITKLYFQNYRQLTTTSAPPSRYKFKKLGSYLKKFVQPKLLFPLIAGGVFISFLLSGYMIEQIPELPDDRQVSIAAHRAGPAAAPENSLQALELTQQTEAEWAEIDVQLSRDSVIVVTHDIDLMRIANNPARIADTNVDQIRQILSRAHANNKSRHQTINTLDEFLAASRGNIKLMIELKQSTETLARKVIDAIREQEMENEVIIISMNLDAIRRTQKIAPDIDVGYVSAFSVGHKSQLPVELLAINHRAISPQLVANAQQQGMEVWAWTVNRANIMLSMIENNVDGIITDKPKLGIQVREDLQKLSTTERLLLQFNQIMEVDPD